jgi:tetratricopeptide (TPR) repeat protein
MPSQDDNCAFEAAPALDAGSFCSSPEPCESYAAGELLSWQQKDALVCRLDEQLQTLAGRLEQIESGVRLFQPLSQQDATARRLETQLNELRGQQKQVEVALRVKRATLLAQMGRSLEARADYLKAAELDPTNRLNLIGLGCLLAATGQRRAARTVYAEAVKHHPDDVVIRVSLGALMLEEGDPAGARAHYEAALRINPEYPQAHGGMYYALTRLGEPEAADFHHRKCFEQQRVIPTLYKGKSPAIPVLLMASSVGGNAPLEKFLDDCVFQTYVAVTDFYDEKTPLPAHRLVVNGIGDADVAAAALAGAEHLLAHTAARVINAPAAIQGTGRCDVARRLSGLPGVVTPRMVTLPREALAAPDAGTTLTLHGFEFPLLARTPGFHIGEHFLRVESLDELPAALAQLPGRDLTVIEYLDARGRDGKARKYRVMMIDGQLYPLHAAISSDWKIHYFSAEMAENPAHREEDAEFLSNMSGVLGPRAVAALDGIQKTLGLDYGGVDFGLNENGEILLFEANATMAVIPPEADSRWDYRRPAVELVRSAVSKMLMDRAKDAF